MESFIIKLQDQFKQIISDLNNQYSEKVQPMISLLENVKLLIDWLNHFTEFYETVVSELVRLKQDCERKDTTIKSMAYMVKKELSNVREELKVIRQLNSSIPNHTSQQFETVYANWNHTIQVMDDFSKSTITKMWESNNDLGRTCNSQAERIKEKNQIISDLQKENQLILEKTNFDRKLSEDRILQIQREYDGEREKVTLELKLLQEELELEKIRNSQLLVNYSGIQEDASILKIELRQLKEMRLKDQLELTSLADQLVKQAEEKKRITATSEKYHQVLTLVWQKIQDLKEDLKSVKTGVHHMRKKYINSLYSDSMNKQSLSNLLVCAVQEVMHHKEVREKNLVVSLNELDEEYKSIAKENTKLHISVTYALQAYNRLRKHITDQRFMEINQIQIN